MGSKKLHLHRSERINLKGSKRKNGFERWRFVTNGVSSITGEERVFFFEFYCVNPSVSPSKAVLGFCNEFDSNLSENIQNVLAGTESAKNLKSQILVIPSFVMVRAGSLSPAGRSINNYYSISEADFEKADSVISIGKPGSEIVLTDSFTAGSVSVTDEDLREHPEYFGNTGAFTWNLNFSKNITFTPDYRSRSINWSVIGGKTDFDGTIIYNGDEFAVTPRNSFGYYDKNWGYDFENPYFHLHSSSITSNISGARCDDSAIAVEGEFNGRLNVLVCMNGRNIEFHADKKKNYNILFDCQELSDDDMGPKLHWSVSVNDRRYVIDIDVYCRTKDLFLRDYESPSGGRKVMRVLGGGSGIGKIKIYRKVKKSLEILEQAEITKCVCEYGNLEVPEF